MEKGQAGLGKISLPLFALPHGRLPNDAEINVITTT
jgi:hypothetical protein